ncbi:hypothetical protein [Conexibacter sp. DBS9H8]|uniref:hypothetical protein n=1 Tax=Conexibacter sp. DBS9H8 TaxID=2937801 RepID=UPI00200D1005|nr:hypothetical protein [Conexibacter sp. DBS9H8]
MQQVNVLLDDGPAEELALMAERLSTDPALLARVLLSDAIALERSREESRQNQPAEHWEEFQHGLTNDSVPLGRYAETI